MQNPLWKTVWQFFSVTTWDKQLILYMTSGGRQVSYHWNGTLQINKRKGYNTHVMVDSVGDIITNYL